MGLKSRIALTLLSCVVVGCPAKVVLVVYNNTNEVIQVNYGSYDVDVASFEQSQFAAYLGDQRFIVRFDDEVVEYEGSFGSLPGKCYGIGRRHSVRVQVNRSESVQVLSVDQSFPAISGNCGKLSEIKKWTVKNGPG